MTSALFLIAFGLLLRQIVPSPALDYGSAEGVVLESHSLKGLADARVTLSGPMGDTLVGFQNRSVSTDANGRFNFTDVTPGRYVLRAVNDGFFQEGPWGTPLTLRPGERRNAITLLLDPGATVKGRINDSDGNPMREVRVTYFRKTVEGLMAGPNPVSVAYAETDTNGNYEIGDLPSGEYYIRAEFMNKRSEETYRSTYHPDALQLATARPVFVRPGATVTGIDIQVQRASLITVSGRLNRIAVSGEAPNVRFALYPRDSNALSEPIGSADATVHPVTGEFQILNVLPGSYTLFAYEIGSTGYRGQRLIDIAGTDLQGISLVLLPPTQLAGRVIGLPRPSSQASRIRLSTNRPSHRPDGVKNIDGLIDEKGQFIFEYVTEGATFFFTPFNPIEALPPDFYIRDMRQGERDILDTGIVFGSSPPEVIEVTVSPGGGRISGKISDQAFAKSAAYIFLLPSGPRSQNRALYKTAISDENGRFTISGITPGAYRLYAWEAMPELGSLDFRFVLRYEDRGIPFTIHERDEIDNVVIRLIPRGQ